MIEIQPGSVFSRLTVVKRVGSSIHKQIIWECECECGNTINAIAPNLRLGKVRSCGCIRFTFKPGIRKRLRGVNSKEYNSWIGMRRRCYDAKHHKYKYYGALGIVVCERWLDSFDSFLADMRPAPSKNHSIDRFPDKNGNYEPENCRWATVLEQNRNKRKFKNVSFI